MRSPKENSLENKIIRELEKLSLSETSKNAVKLILSDEEVQLTQDIANNVSIVRLGINDHGPVHMRIVALNVIIMLGLLREEGIKTSMENEESGDFEDSLIACVYASMLHDLGMSIGRQDHELHSTNLSLPILDRLLASAFPGNLRKKLIIQSIALEAISGHMGNRSINSLEAGLVQIADGCDMTSGRARISMSLSNNPRAGDIHQYSANSIENVRIIKGQEKPIRLEVSMSSEVGLFQVEEVLLGKISRSTAKPYIELFAQVKSKDPKRYL